jgi:hypothetical protein
MTTTEIIMNLAVWVLLLCGLFFGIRARSRRRKKPPAPQSSAIDQKP